MYLVLLLQSVCIAQVKPTTLQVNLSSCCVVPQELSSFAQQNDVQVLTHNDAAGEILFSMEPQFSNWNLISFCILFKVHLVSWKYTEIIFWEFYCRFSFMLEDEESTLFIVLVYHLPGAYYTNLNFTTVDW